MSAGHEDPRQPGRYHERWLPQSDTAERDVLLFTLYRLIVGGAGARLYACRICDMPFVRHRKQIFSTPACMRIAQHRKKSAKRKTKRQAKRDVKLALRQAYEQQRAARKERIRVRRQGKGARQ